MKENVVNIYLKCINVKKNYSFVYVLAVYLS